MAIKSGRIKSMILAVIMVTVLFSIGVSVLPLLTGSYYDLSVNYNETQIGTAAATFAENSVAYTGWFIVLGPFLLLIGVGLSIWQYKKTRY